MTLRARQLGVRFGALVALEDCNLELQAGSCIGLLGPNGAGKTSLLRGLAALVPHAGTVEWQGRPLAALGRRERARTIAYLPQSTSVPWPLTVRALTELGRLPHRRFGEPLSAADHGAVELALAAANMTQLAERRIDSLSGGELMRAHLARVLAVDAPVVLVDEPVANLDPSHQLMVMERLGEYARGGRTVVAVMHDLTLAARFCDRIVLLSEGRIVGDGPPQTTLTAAAVEAVYGVTAVIGQHDGEPLVVPWQRASARG